MTTKAKTPETTKAPAERKDATDEKPVTKLAVVNDPAKVTNAKIDEIAADDGTDEPENSANQDAAEHLKDERKKAKSGEEYMPHAGGFAGEPG